MPTEELGLLRIQSQGGVRVADVSEFLIALGDAYDSIAALANVLHATERWHGYMPPSLLLPPLEITLALAGMGPRKKGQQRDPLRQYRLRPRRRLVLERVRLESPGEWVFSGVAQVLDVVRQYLHDRDERRKDKEYREAAEKQRLMWENRILENKFFAGRVRSVRDLGATDDDLAPLLRGLLFNPLESLNRFQDMGLIQGVDGQASE